MGDGQCKKNVQIFETPNIPTKWSKLRYVTHTLTKHVTLIKDHRNWIHKNF